MLVNKSRASYKAFSSALGVEISRLRRERSLTGKELGKLIGVSQQQISRYENGVCDMPFITLCKLLHSLNVSLDDFFYLVSSELKCNSPVLYEKYQNLFVQEETSYAVMKGIHSRFQ